jgi:hypothetical protein
MTNSAADANDGQAEAANNRPIRSEKELRISNHYMGIYASLEKDQNFVKESQVAHRLVCNGVRGKLTS